MNDMPLALTGSPEASSDGTLAYVEGEVFARVAPVMQPSDEGSAKEESVVLPSFTESMTVENMRQYMLGEKTAAELLGLTMFHLVDLAEVGVRYFREGKLHDAHEVFKMLVNLNPRYARFRNLLGATFFGLEQFDAAKLQYEKATELDPELFEAWFNLAEIARTQNEWQRCLDFAEKSLTVITSKYSEESRSRAQALVELAGRELNSH